MNQQLYLLRHAHAEPWNPMGNDFSRPLSKNGAQHANALAAWAQDKLDIPDTVLCSPSKRTRETLAPLLSRWPQLLSVTDYVESMYGASLDMLLTLAGDAFSFSQRVLMVGHNPACQILLSNIQGIDQAPGVDRMATGTLAVIEFPGGFRQQLANGRLLQVRNREDF